MEAAISNHLLPFLKVLENLEVWESLEREGKGHVHQQYRLRFSFLPQECYDVSMCY